MAPYPSTLIEPNLSHNDLQNHRNRNSINYYNSILNIISNANNNTSMEQYHNNSNTSLQTVNIRVKLIYTTIERNYIFPSDATIEEMIQYLTSRVSRDFQFFSSSHSPYYQRNLEFVLMEQNYHQGSNSEAGLAFQPTASPSPSIHNYFPNQTQINFYVRPCDDTTPQCMVCFEYNLPSLSRAFGCSHHICHTCLQGCRTANITNCALCRHSP
jgi:hypothetical protein